MGFTRYKSNIYINPINENICFQTMNSLYLSQARTWIYNVICSGHFCAQWVKGLKVRFVDINGIVVSFFFIILHCVNEFQIENYHSIIIVRFILSITKRNHGMIFLAQDIYLNVSCVRPPLNKPIRMLHRQTYCLLNQSISTFTLHWRVIIEWISLIWFRH